MIDPTDISRQQEAIAAKAKRERRQIEIERVELRRILSSSLGRGFVMRIIERAGVFQQPFIGGGAHGDGRRETDFALGMKNEGLRLFQTIVDSCPELWTTMLNERAERLEQEAKEAQDE